MRIAFIYDAVHPWITGGAQKRVWELAHRLAESHDVHWYGQKYWEGPETITREGVTLHGVCEPMSLYVEGRRSIKQALYFTAHLLPELVSNGYDIIDCQEFPYFPCYVSRLSSALHDTAFCITWYEVWNDYWYEYLGKLGLGGKFIETSVARLDAMHIATSKMTQEDLYELGANDVRRSPLGIDFEQLDSIEPAGQDVNILFGGRLIPEKNAELFVDAFDELTGRGYDGNAIIIGEGPERETVEARISDIGIEESISVIDFVEHDEFLSYIKAADVFAFPSQREGFGLVGLEALACGTPVVTSNHPQNAAQELVEAGHTGCICDLDADDLASKLLQAQNIDSDVCREFAQQYDWNNIAAEMESYYEEAVASMQ